MNKPTFAVAPEKPIKFAFEIHNGKLYETEQNISGSTKFYEFVDFNEMPVKRALYSMTVLNEVSQKLTKERLLTFLEAMETEINAPTVHIVELVKLITALRERTEMIFEPESIYKIASIVYFTQQENPNDYSQIMGFQNIKLFQSVQDHTFFLSIPIKKCMPQTNLSDEDLVTYLELAKKINKMELKSLTDKLSKTPKTKDLFSLLKLQKSEDLV